MFPEDVFPLNCWPLLRKDVMGKAKNKSNISFTERKSVYTNFGQNSFFPLKNVLHQKHYAKQVLGLVSVFIRSYLTISENPSLLWYNFQRKKKQLENGLLIPCYICKVNMKYGYLLNLELFNDVLKNHVYFGLMGGAKTF